MNINNIKLNHLEIKSFDRQISRYCTDWVTRYEYISTDNLTIAQYENILKAHNLTGEIRFIKKILNFANGQKLYKHICETVMY